MSQPAHILAPLTFPLSGSALIEASAGTGKTYTLALLYLRLVLQHGGQNRFDKPLLPPNILVVTFTKAATRELRDRIRARLVEAASYFRGDLTDQQVDDLLITLKQDTLAQQDLSSAARQLDIAAEWMDEAAVSTIHSWCSRVLSEHAFYSGLSFSQTLVENEKPLIIQACEDYWRENIFPLQEEPLRQVLSFFKAPDALYQLAKGLIYQVESIPQVDPDLGARIVAILKERKEAIQALKEAVTQAIPVLEQEFAAANKAKLYKAASLKKNHLSDTLAKLSQWGATEQEELDLLPSLFKGKTFDKIALVDTSIWHDPSNIPISSDAAKVLADLPEQIKALTTPREYLIAHAVHWIAKRVEDEKAQQGVLSQNDLLIKLDQALQGPGGGRLAEVIRQQFPVALVDEFQDTDPVQYRIFNQIYRVADPYPQTGFFMIGDPKQAIYRFRGADIFTYLAAKQDTGDRQYTLNTNFRSAPGLVEKVNAYFEFAEENHPKGAFLFKSKERNPIGFHPVNAGRSAEIGLYLNDEKYPEQCLWFTPPTDEDGVEQKWDRAEMTANEVANWLTLSQAGSAQLDVGKGRRPLVPSDFAILVHNGTQAKQIRRALFQLGVSSVYLSDSNDVFDTDEANDVLAVLRAMAEPFNSFHLRIALGTRLMGMQLDQLDRLNRDEVFWEEQIELFRSYHQHWHQFGIMAVLHRFYYDRKVAARYLSAPNGERSITDLFHITELLQQATETIHGQQALIHHLEQCITAEKSGVESTQQRLESDADLVQVVTVHKSKGLQYPIVMLPYFDHVREVKAKDAYVDYHDHKGNLVLALKPEDHDLEQADAERLAEDVRKLYVAMTRGICAQWLAVEEPKGKKDEPAQLTSAAHVLMGFKDGMVLNQYFGLTDAFTMVEPITMASAFQPQQQDSYRPARQVTHKDIKPWWISSYSALSFSGSKTKDQGETVAEVAKDEQANDDDDTFVGQELQLDTSGSIMHRLPKGSHIGTFLHGLIEWAAEQRYMDESGQGHFGFAAASHRNNEQRLNTLRARCRNRGLEHEAQDLSDWLSAFLQQEWQLNRLPDGTGPSFKLTDLTPQQVAVEMEFMFSANEVNTRLMDQLVCEHTWQGAPRPVANFQRISGMLKGFIDMVAEIEGRYYVVDWKSNFLGSGDEAYHDSALQQALLKKRYDLQYVLYLLALHRHLRDRVQGYNYDTHIGGAVYFFLRGWQNPETQGLVMDKPPKSLIEKLDKLFAGVNYETQDDEEAANV
ncbi:exodeoxyribonuclease V subunit beta [Maribrevibacterium harenarium]|uniref:RecBCD enzyme subunit RecB n=1 Tax=Maribrevibacterium harenarium TaxID=2589817 RepID=A0A501WTM0_9GAMM|nr:exodeoxyribonuclease V subunit beta [Maribrevibacterium harenarium]TPE50687.1 exodeoxyribonuclease V subunit beta [Maribrevibacterium harenarium]